MIYLQKKKQKKVLKYEKEGKAMNLLYKSTRNADKTVTASEAILKGLADDGGLFAPVAVPKLDVTMDELKSMSGDCLRGYEKIPYRFYGRRTEALH